MPGFRVEMPSVRHKVVLRQSRWVNGLKTSGVYAQAHSSVEGDL